MFNKSATEKFAPSLDRYARMVVRETDAPTGLVTVVGTSPDDLLLPGVNGWGDGEDRHAPLSASFCKFVIRSGVPFIVTDARSDERVSDLPSVLAGDVRAYAGYPLRNRHDKVIGSVCAVDSEPRIWSSDDLLALSDLAEATSAEVARRELRLRLEAAWTAVGILVLGLVCLLVSIYRV